MPLNNDPMLSINDLFGNRWKAYEEGAHGPMDPQHFVTTIREADPDTVLDAISFFEAPGTIRYFLKVGQTTEDFRIMWDALRAAALKLDLPMPSHLR